MRQIILDTETTGLDSQQGHRIIEIGCVEMLDRRLNDNYFHRYINPQREIDAAAQQVHGISVEFLADKPLFADIMPSFLDYIQGAELIIHNAPFDIGFLNYELQLVSSKTKLIEDYCTITDTLPLARELHPGKRNNLDALCERYHIDNSQRDLHGGLMDAKLLGLVYLAMTSGQDSLFNDLDASLTYQQVDKQIATAAGLLKGGLKILSATDDELNQHQAYLATMQQQGHCIWLND